MRYRSFRGVQVSEVGFGAWGIGGAGPGMKAYGPVDDATSTAALKRAVDVGITFIDTSDVYGAGHSEELIGAAGIRGKVFLATKVGYDGSQTPVRSNWSAEHLTRALEASLRRLRTDRVDLVQLHNPTVADMGAMETLRRTGKARFVGVSIKTPEEARAAVEAGADSVQIAYNYVEQEHRMRTFGVPAAIVVREPLGRGLLSGKFTASSAFPATDVRSGWSREEFARRLTIVEEFRSLVRPGLSMARAALKFVLSSPEVTVVIPGIKTPAQAEENAAASDGQYKLVGDIFESEDIEAGFGGDA